MSRWLIDYDGTIANTQQVMLDVCNAYFGESYGHHDITAWKTEDFLPLEYVQYMWGKDVWLNEEVQAKAQPVKGAIAGINTLLANDHHLMIVSDRPASLFEVTRDWLDRQGLEMVRLLFTRHKHSMNQDPQHMTKLQAAYRYQLRLMIDDSVHHPLAFAEKSYIDHIYLLDMPYNQHVEGDKITRVNSWSQIPYNGLL